LGVGNNGGVGGAGAGAGAGGEERAATGSHVLG
jgi:hypothetical protein